MEPSTDNAAAQRELSAAVKRNYLTKNKKVSQNSTADRIPKHECLTAT